MGNWGRDPFPYLFIQRGGVIIQPFLKYINLGMKHFLNLLLAVLTVSVFMQVVFRFLIEQPLAWTEELARYCLIWITFLGAAYAMSLRAHLGVEFFVNSFPLLGRKIMAVVASIVSLSFFSILVIYGFQLVNKSTSQTSPVLDLPMGFVYLVIPISGIFLIINLLANTISDVLKKEGESNDDPAL